MTDIEPVEPTEIIGPELRQAVPDDDERDIRIEGFQNLTKAERQEMSQRGVAARRANKRARQLAELEVYTDAHRAMASQILGTKMTLLDGLVAEMRTEDGGLDTSLLDDKRLKVLMQLMDQIEKRAFGGPVTKTETKVSGELDMRMALVDLTKRLQKPDSV